MPHGTWKADSAAAPRTNATLNPNAPAFVPTVFQDLDKPSASAEVAPEQGDFLYQGEQNTAADNASPSRRQRAPPAGMPACSDGTVTEQQHCEVLNDPVVSSGADALPLNTAFCDARAFLTVQEWEPVLVASRRHKRLAGVVSSALVEAGVAWRAAG